MSNDWCDVCKQQTGGGSHYHCGRCLDAQPTSQYGHYTRFADGTRGFCCDPANLGKSYGYEGQHKVTEEQVRPPAATTTEAAS